MQQTQESEAQRMATEREILQALEGLPPAARSQVRDFIVFLKEQHAARRAPKSEKAVAAKTDLND